MILKPMESMKDPPAGGFFLCTFLLYHTCPDLSRPVQTAASGP
jgi:hypothetical protein